MVGVTVKTPGIGGELVTIISDDSEGQSDPMERQLSVNVSDERGGNEFAGMKMLIDTVEFNDERTKMLVGTSEANDKSTERSLIDHVAIKFVSG